MAKKEEVLSVLEDLLKMDDILACMLARKDLGGVVPEKFKVKDVNLWNLVKSSSNLMFPIIDKFYNYKINRLNFELNDYTIMLAPVNQIYSILVIIPSLANMGLIDVELENSKRKIKKILDSQV